MILNLDYFNNRFVTESNYCLSEHETFVKLAGTEIEPELCMNRSTADSRFKPWRDEMHLQNVLFKR